MVLCFSRTRIYGAYYETNYLLWRVLKLYLFVVVFRFGCCDVVFSVYGAVSENITGEVVNDEVLGQLLDGSEVLKLYMNKFHSYSFVTFFLAGYCCILIPTKFQLSNREQRRGRTCSYFMKQKAIIYQCGIWKTENEQWWKLYFSCYDISDDPCLLCNQLIDACSWWFFFGFRFVFFWRCIMFVISFCLFCSLVLRLTRCNSTQLSLCWETPLSFLDYDQEKIYVSFFHFKYFSRFHLKHTILFFC